MHVILLGDSVFDNVASAGHGLDVQSHLRQQLPADEVTLLAVDGAMIEHVPFQLVDFPFSVTHMVLSIGGNNLLQHAALAHTFTGTVVLALARMHDLVLEFEQAYLELVQKLISYELPFVLCTLHNPRFEKLSEHKGALTGMTLFNDVIYRTALRYQLPLLEMREVCNVAEDFAFPHEISDQGGAKIAAALARLLREHDFTKRRTIVYGGVSN